MGRIKLPWCFIKEFRCEQLHQACQMISERNLQPVIEILSQETLEYLVRDPAFIPYLAQICQKPEGIYFNRIDALLQGAAQEILSEYPLQKIIEVLEDETVKTPVQFWYLRYYYDFHLNKEKKVELVNGLMNWKERGNMDIKDFSKEERNLLIEPAFSTQLLVPIYKEKELWNQLLKPDKLKFFNTLAEAAAPCQQLRREHFLEFVKNNEEFQNSFLTVIGYLEKEIHPFFVEMWLENDVLLQDIRRLKKLLPDMDREQIREMMKSKIYYMKVLYKDRLQDIPLMELDERKREIIFYAAKKNKKHFLNLVRSSYQLFIQLPSFSLLLEPDTYKKYLNLNTLTSNNLKECYHLSRLSNYKIGVMVQNTYTFEELMLLSTAELHYCTFYHELSYERSDMRIKVFRELIKHNCLPAKMERNELIHLGKCLSQKALSMWMHDELSHIRHLRHHTAVRLLAHWQEVKKFVPYLTEENQVLFLLRNKERIKEFSDFQEMKEHIIETDHAWKWLKDNLCIDEAFIQKYKENIIQFLCEGGSEILFAFCNNEGRKMEEIRRLLMAELMGRFKDLKYHRNDLEKEIAYPISTEIQNIWMENSELSQNGYHAWEEDRLLPVMQMGEIPESTCLSYIDGGQCECLLSCFDSNKKIIYLEKDGVIVCRAILRLTKGSYDKIDHSPIEFADFTRSEEEQNEEVEKKEELILFLERLYYKHLSNEELKTAVECLICMVKEKAENLGIKIVLSPRYYGIKGFVSSNYYIYISTSKNGSQYLDSLGGMATVAKSGSYKSVEVFLEKEDILPMSA